MADHAVSAPVSSENPIWETWAKQDKELRVVTQHIWHVAQRLQISTGYSGLGVDDMIAIDKELSIKVKVKIQVQRLEDLNTMATELASAHLAPSDHNRGILDGSAQGSLQLARCDIGSQQQDLNAAIKRTAQGLLETPAVPLKRMRKLPRNKVGNHDVEALISASRPAAGRQALLQRPIPPNMRAVRYGYKKEFVHHCVATQHATYWDAEKPRILLPCQLTQDFSEYMGRNKNRFKEYVQVSHFPQTNGINCAMLPIKIWAPQPIQVY